MYRIVLHHVRTGSSEKIGNVLLLHANGFHGKIWPLNFTRHFDAFNVFACDLRGFGDSSRHEEKLTWSVFREDIMTAVKNASGFVRQVLKEDKVLPWYGFGHSIGGAALLSYAAEMPSTFAGIACFEPVFKEYQKAESSPLAQMARKRKHRFQSLTEARSNFENKPPFNTFDKGSVSSFFSCLHHLCSWLCSRCFGEVC